VDPSDSGKSTLLNVVACIDEPDSGSVKLENIDVRSLSDDQRSRLRNQKFGFIFQSFNLVPVLTVIENVELPLLIYPGLSSVERHERAKTAIADVGLEIFSHQVPDKLSSGQRQRVAIAQALVTQPLLVLADEPTTNLDSATAHKIIDLILELNSKKKMTFLFSTHDEKLMARVTRTLHIKDWVI
jgi:putative ABC transport system ATP-binding protein